jgi:hypothetical protein
MQLTDFFVPDDPLDQIPSPQLIQARKGQLLRELSLLRRLERLSQQTRQERGELSRTAAGEGGHG